MKTGRSVAAAILVCLIPAAPAAAERHDFSIPAGRLSTAIADLAQQGGLDIGTTDPDLARAPTRGVHGRLSPRAALDRLLAGSGYHAVAIDRSAYRLERDRVKRARPATVVAVDTETPAGNAIVVSASKRSSPILRFPGSVTMMGGRPDQFGDNSTRDMHDVAAGMPILQTTALGDGRNKLFVRGIADSSFAGPTRSTANVYFGEVQLGYNGADPNLNLYDVDRVEVLEGPQGALYGAGSIGGIIRMAPRSPDPDRFAASAAAGISTTQGGGRSDDLAAMMNVPLVPGVAALRLVGYRTQDGGYVDDRRRRLANINTVNVRGGRAALRLAPGDGWTIDLGLLGQTTRAPDSQYIQRELPGLSRSSAIAQPFEDDFLLGRAIIARQWSGGLKLLSATGYVQHRSDDRYDATSRLRPNALLAYDTHDRNRMITQEVRLSHNAANGDGWLAGFSYIDDRDAIQRELGSPGRPQDIAGVTNRAIDLSAFGEGTLSLGPAVSVTAGGRLTRTRTDSDPSFVRGDAKFVRGKNSFRLSPIAGANWLVAPGLALFTRYGSGFRTGGLAVAPGIGRVATFTPDTINVIEAGVRIERRGATGFSGSASLSRARWRAIQADLIDRRGFPFTTNIGNGRIRGLEATGDWVPLANLHLNSSVFINHSRLSEPITALARQEGDSLPDTPRFAIAGGASYGWPVGPAAMVTLSATASYAGESVVGFGPMLDIKQGGYGRADVAAEWKRGVLGVTLGVTNIGNVRGNRFSLGNPFGIGDRDQMTPVRPRTLRLGLSIER